MDVNGRTFLLTVCLLAVLVALIFANLPAALGGDAEAPALSVSSFEPLETGCADDIATYSRNSLGNGSFTRVSFVETGSETANLSARTERTSPVGVSLSTFRVHVDAADRGTHNASCEMGVRYKLELSYDEGSTGDLFGDDGIRVLWLENGNYSGCSSSTSGTLDSECYRFTADNQSPQAWANTTETRSGT